MLESTKEASRKPEAF